MSLQVFICGATGHQGSNVAAHLQKSNIPMHAVSRNPDAQVPGVKFHQGSYADVDVIKTAMKGCNALYMNLSPDFTDTGAEQRYADTLLQAAKEAGVQHVIYSSGLSVDNPHKLAYFDPDSALAGVLLSKQAIEAKVRTSGIKHWTIFRPGSYMQNFVKPLVNMYSGLVDQGKWLTAMQGDTIVPLVDVYTVGLFAKTAFAEPDRFHQQDIGIADEKMEVNLILAKLSATTGRKLEANLIPEEEALAQAPANPFVAGQLAVRNLATFVDLQDVKSWELPLSSFDAFLTRESGRVQATYQL